MAKILIADDNIMNCKMALRILEPLQWETNTAENGKVALEMIARDTYDLVLMDHMMPVMDGVEAVRRLRAMEGSYYGKLPVIALSASTEEGTERLFLDAGMNDYVAKPIQAERLYQVLQRWLPEEEALQAFVAQQFAQPHKEDAIQQSEVVCETEALGKNYPSIEGIDVQEGIQNSGGIDFLFRLMGIFYQIIDMKSQKIVQCISDSMIRDYTIEVHGLKNTARMIGAVELSKEFEYLEKLGNAGDKDAIETETPKVLSHYLCYKTYLKPYGAAVSQEGREAPAEEMILYLQGICDAMEGFDLDSADEVFAQLDECRIPTKCVELLEELRAYIADVDMEHVIIVAQRMIKVLENERG